MIDIRGSLDRNFEMIWMASDGLFFSCWQLGTACRIFTGRTVEIGLFWGSCLGHCGFFTQPCPSVALASQHYCVMLRTPRVANCPWFLHYFLFIKNLTTWQNNRMLKFGLSSFWCLEQLIGQLCSLYVILVDFVPKSLKISFYVT